MANSRIYTRGITSEVENKHNKKLYIISSSSDSAAPTWQLAVFENKGGSADPFQPLLLKISHSFEEAEKLHIQTEETVSEKPVNVWKEIVSQQTYP